MKLIIEGKEMEVDMIYATEDPEYLRIQFTETVTEELKINSILVKEATYLPSVNRIPVVERPSADYSQDPVAWDAYFEYKAKVEKCIVEPAVYKENNKVVRLEKPRVTKGVVKNISKVVFNKENPNYVI